ncbi:MAG: hypothetical protein ACE5HJ_05010 [Thermoplasmata archaeon]
MGTILGILTADFRLYHDLVSHLKERDIPFISLSFNEPVPPEVGVILTSPEELRQVDFEGKVPCEDVQDAVAKALQLLSGKTSFREVVVGIDPGPRPGVAILGDEEVVDTRTASSPEAVLKILLSVLRNYETEVLRVRIGHGDPTNRNRIINALSRIGQQAEIVDEKGTTKRYRRRDDARNIESAIDIAMGRGVTAETWYDIFPTEGELREIQRRSRISSGGRLTISRQLAERVARGEITLSEAITEQSSNLKSPK